MTINRPSDGDCKPYFFTYVNLVPEGDIIPILEQQLENTLEQLETIPDYQGNYRYAAGKWSLNEVIGHISDNERIMSYRLLCIARGDKTPLAGYDQDEYMKTASYDSQSLPEVIQDYSLVRSSTISLLKGLSPEAWSRRGIVDNNETTVTALAYIIAGHELHHRKIINERYRK